MSHCTRGGRAKIARAAGINLPNLSGYLRTGLQTLLSKPLRDRLLQEVGLTAGGWFRAGCHVWRTENLDNAVLALKWLVPEKELVSVRELRSEDGLLDERSALVLVYLLRWMVAESPRRVLLQLRVTEDAASEARRRLIQCGICDVRDHRIPVLGLAPTEHARLSEIDEIGMKAFDDLFDRDSEVTWDIVFKLLPSVFKSASAAFGVLQAHGARLSSRCNRYRRQPGPRRFLVAIRRLCSGNGMAESLRELFRVEIGCFPIAGGLMPEAVWGN